MGKKVVAIVGSYRKGGTVDTAVDAVLEGAEEHGAETKKIYLVDQHIEYCRNCRSCTQVAGETRGKCLIEDDVAGILAQIDAADAIVLGAPVNYYNVTAVFRTFMERTLGSTYWPWGQWRGPTPRMDKLPRKAVLISSLAAPGIFLPFMTGVPKALRVAANCLGAKPVARLWIGLAGQSPKAQVSVKMLQRARRIGADL